MLLIDCEGTFPRVPLRRAPHYLAAAYYPPHAPVRLPMSGVPSDNANGAASAQNDTAGSGLSLFSRGCKESRDVAPGL
eukprot:COSAG01_NODE_791_length_13556_cov_214.163930_2_plen_78_part_00